jgi:hypothetical protein
MGDSLGQLKTEKSFKTSDILAQDDTNDKSPTANKKSPTPLREQGF